MQIRASVAANNSSNNCDDNEESILQTTIRYATRYETARSSKTKRRMEETDKMVLMDVQWEGNEPSIFIEQ